MITQNKVKKYLLKNNWKKASVCSNDYSVWTKNDCQIKLYFDDNFVDYDCEIKFVIQKISECEHVCKEKIIEEIENGR